MMGDNRHNSADSRSWGFVPEDHIVGKPIMIWLSLDKDRGWFDGKIRWERLFHGGSRYQDRIPMDSLYCDHDWGSMGCPDMAVGIVPHFYAGHGNGLARRGLYPGQQMSRPLSAPTERHRALHQPSPTGFDTPPALCQPLHRDTGRYDTGFVGRLPH